MGGSLGEAWTSWETTFLIRKVQFFFHAIWWPTPPPSPPVRESSPASPLMSTTYHPQTDGQSERTNQSLEVFIRCHCNEEQDNWHIWLPMAEFAHNQWPNATTKKAPFDLIMGYVPCHEHIKKPSSVPQVKERLAELERVRKVAWDLMLRAQSMLWIRNPEGRKFHPYQIGEQVWIEGTNLKTLYPSAKLGPK
jgi:hypothetical protein